MAKTDPHFRLRISEDLKERVMAAAKENNRSINAEINYLVEYALDTIERHDALALVPFPDEATINEELSKQDLESGSKSASRGEFARRAEAEQHEFATKTDALMRKLDELAAVLSSDRTVPAAHESDEVIMKRIAERLGYQVTKK
ncbi:Arc family DNA-binding protein [Ciceribacter thiooxidans]|uniref:Arc family DNA-binding protein n=1 Tax=Ciceribacter thiooxidans TaxID=1969821 RepID=A0ABV7I420_9HYPH|nr:Arc family DNA-binding protein [Ciceribacter thiooxidans]